MPAIELLTIYNVILIEVSIIINRTIDQAIFYTIRIMNYHLWIEIGQNEIRSSFKFILLKKNLSVAYHL